MTSGEGLPVLYRPYFVVAAVIWAAWVASWIIAGFWTARTTNEAPRGSYRLYLILAMLGFILLFAQPHHPHPLWPVVPLIGWMGIGLVVIGVAFAWWARIRLGALWSGGIVRREGHRIVDDGPYAIVRHPIYTALILCGIGVMLLQATLLSVAGAALIAIGFGLKARVEERFLAAELGEQDYAAYRARVPMLVPFTRRG